MKPLTEPQIRAAFVNMTKGEVKRMNVPRDPGTQPWDDLDYLGWRDPQSPGRGYVVADIDGRDVGIALRAPASSAGARPSMCALCLTVRSGGVSLMVAPLAGKAGKAGHTVGTTICSDLACSLYVRGKLQTGTPGMYETLALESRVDRLVANLEAFVARVDRTP